MNKDIKAKKYNRSYYLTDYEHKFMQGMIAISRAGARITIEQPNKETPDIKDVSEKETEPTSHV